MRVLCIILISATLFGCSTSRRIGHITKTWDEVSHTTLSDIKFGIPVYDEAIVDYKRAGKTVLKVKLYQPAIVGVAAKPEKWGFFQFPSIYSSQDNSIVAKWNMSEDAVESYGKGEHGGFAVSRDGGKSWSPNEGEPPIGGGLLLPGGDRIKIHTPKAIATGELKLPIPVVANKGGIGLYKLSELPEILQGVYLNRLAKGGTSWTTEHNVLDDPQAVRYTISGLFPLVWWGDINIASDGSIIAGIYPGFYINEKGAVDPSGILFYRSTDEGRSWKIQGRIPYEPDLKTDPKGDKRLAFGFTEPAFEILSDGTFLCVMRSTDSFVTNSPMYLSRSTDLGVNWSKPSTFTWAGVLPRLLQLDNGVIVLASGRPGMQLRFCIDGKGEKWTDPFEMLPFENENETVSCGYTGLLAIGPDSFLLIYSDFKYHNKDNEIRKAIKVREIKVSPKKSPVISDALKKECVEALRTILQTQSEWVKVHAAEFLLGSGYPEGVQDIYLEEEKQWGNKSPYRIAIWRVLSKAATKPEEKKIWTDKIIRAFLDTNGADRIHAAETLAKLHISPLTEYPEITAKTLDSPVRSLSLYTRWSVAFSSQDSLLNVRKSFFDLATSGNEDVASRRLAAYVVSHSGDLPPSEWEIFAQSALSEPEGSEVKINLLNAAVITATDDAAPSDLYRQVYEAFLKYKNVAKKAIRLEIAAGLAEKSKPEDLPILISFPVTYVYQWLHQHLFNPLIYLL